MDLSFNSKMEAYYQKFIELQEKLRKSEEERLKLEMKFNEMLQVTREEEQAHYKKLRSQYKRFLEEDRKRQERNERIIRTLERIEARVNMLTSRTDRFKMLKRQYQSYIQRISHIKPTEKTEHPSPKIEEDTFHEQQTHNISEHHTDMPDHLSLKKAMGKSNEEKIEILDKYLQGLATQKCRDTIDNEGKDSQSDLSQLRYLDNISKKMDDGFNSNQANSIAEDIMNSIYSRHYKKDLFKDDAQKASKFATSNYLNDIPSKQKSSQVGDSYDITSAFENFDNNTPIGKNVSFDEFHKNRPTSNYEDNDSVIRNDSKFKGFNRTNYTPRDNIPKSLGMYSQQADNNTLYKNKDYRIETDPLVTNSDYKSKADSLLKNEEYKSKNFTRNDSECFKSNQNQSEIDPLFKSMSKRNNPDSLLKDTDYQTKEYASNDVKVNQINRQVDPLSKSMEYRNKADQLLKEKDPQSKDFTANDSKYLKLDQRVKFEKLEDDKVYVPSKTEIDITENEKQIVSNYPVPREEIDTNINKLSDDICDRVVKQPNQIGANQREIQHSRQAQHQEHYDTEFADNEMHNRDKHLADHAEQVDNNIRKTQNREELTKSIRQENDSDSVINNERQEIETTIPDDQFDENQLVTDLQNIPKYEKKIDIPSNEEIQDTYVEKQVINEDQAQYIQNESPIQYDQYEEPIQYDQFGNQIMYDENGQVVETQYDENAFNQDEPFDEIGQQNYDENKLNVQYDENGQPIQSYDQQYGVDEQPVLYDQQYDASGQPVQQLYDENGQVYQQYDENGQLHSYNQNSHPIQYEENGDLIPQYGENGQLMQQYDGSAQPMHLYDQSDQPIEYAENSQPIQEYGENEQPTEQYINQDRQSVQEYEQPVQQYQKEQPVEQYNQGDQLVQEYEQPFQQYDANGQPIPQYDENGQPIYQYDNNVQPLQQYDENGQLIHQYDENSLHQYNENDQPPEEYDEKSQSILQGENAQLSQDVPVLGTYDNELGKHDRNDESLEDKAKTESSKSTVKEDVNSPMIEENSESQPVKQKNVLDMLDTDTESVKQSTSKVSNDSDFDFSNG